MRPDEAVLKIEAISAVRPEMKPVCDIALAVVRAAEAEIAKAEARAALAENLVKNVRPQMDALVQVAKDATARADAKEAVVKRVTDEQRRDAAIGALVTQQASLAGTVEVLVKNQERIRKDAVQLLQAIHASTRDQNGKSAIENRAPYAGSPWSVVDISGDVISVVECRKDAVQLVVKLLEEEKLEAQRRGQPGEAHAVEAGDFTPGQGQSTRPDAAASPEWHQSPYHPDDEDEEDDVVVPGYPS